MGGFDLSDLLWPDLSQGRQPQFALEKDPESTLYRGAVNSAAIFVGNNSTIAKVNGAHGVASSFNGTSDYATIGGMPNVPETTMFLLVRFRSAVTGSSIKQPIGRSSADGRSLLGMSWDHANSSFQKVWQVSRSYSWYPTPYLSTLNAGEYYLLSATATTTQLRIFKNGALDNVGSISGSTHTPLSNLYVGSGDTGGAAGAFIDADIVLAGEIPLAMTDAWHRELADNPWKLLRVSAPIPFSIPSAGGGITIACTPGNATTAGITAGISSATTIACNVGNASTAGVACALPTTISCNVGNVTTAGVACSLPVVVQCSGGTATTAGVTAGISLDTSITIACNAGNATTTGVSATFPQTLSCSVGNATTAGITAQVDIAGHIVIGCNAGTATTTGIQANISSAFALACNAGNAATLGATAYFPQVLQCSPGNAIVVGIDATFTVAGPTTIVCNVGNATASGISFSFGGTLVDAPNGSGPAIIIPRTTRPPNIGGIRI